MLRHNSLSDSEKAQRITDKETQANLGIPRVTWLMLAFSELVPLPVSLSLSSTVPTDTKCSSEFSAKLQVIHCLPNHCLGEILTPSYATVKTWRSNPALWGSFWLPRHPSLPFPTNLQSLLPILPSIKGGDADNKSLQCTLSVRPGSCQEAIPALQSLLQCMCQQGGDSFMVAWGSLPSFFSQPFTHRSQ